MHWSQTPMPSDLPAIIAAAARSSQAPVTTDTIGQIAHRAELPRTHGALGEPTPLAWHPRLPILATTWDGDWWSASGQRLATLTERGTAAWGANGRNFVTQEFSPAITARVYTFETAQICHLTLPENASILANPAYPQLAISRAEGIFGWHIGTDEQFRFASPPQEAHQRRSPAWSPDGMTLVLEDHRRANFNTKQSVQFWRDDGVLLSRRQLKLPAAGSWHWHPRSHIVISRHANALIWWDSQGEPQNAYQHASPIAGSYHADQYVAWSPDGQLVAILGDNKVLIFTADQTYLRTYASPSGASSACLAWHPSGSMLSMGDWSSTIHTWSVDGTLLHSLPTWHRLSGYRVPFMMQWSPDGSCLAVSSRDCSVNLYGLPEGSQ